jgi:hypothetical protein
MMDVGLCGICIFVIGYLIIIVVYILCYTHSILTYQIGLLNLRYPIHPTTIIFNPKTPPEPKTPILNN